MAKQKAQIQPILMHALPNDVRLAIIAAKNSIRNRIPGRGAAFTNTPAVLPNLDDGCEYFEFDVGAARPGDPQGQRGKRRLVIEIVTKPREVREIYFTDEHYTSGSFRRVV
jgi:guanyl-specific ribonuclease Sa